MTDIIGGLGSYADTGLSTNEVEELQKALGTGQMIGNALGEGYVDGGAPFRVQSLESVLKILTFQESNIKFWQNIPKQQAFNTAEEYNVLKSYGGGGSGFIPEGGLPPETDSQYERRVVLIKFMGEVGIVTHPLTLVTSAVGNPIGREAKNKTINLLAKLEKALFTADSDLDALAFDGVEKAIQTYVDENPLAENIIDLRGAPLNEDVMEDLARIVADQAGRISHFFAGNRAFTDLAKQILPNARFTLPTTGAPAALGMPIDRYHAQTGSFELVPNYFLRASSTPKALADYGSPATISDMTLSAAPATGSLFKSTATLYYAISSVNTNGESLICAAHSVSVASRDGVSISVANIPAYVKGFRIYRGTSETNMREMKTVKAPVSAGVIHVDLDMDIPGTSKGYGIMLDSDQGIAYKQLSPLMKMDLATINTTYRFMLLLYGSPVFYAPQKMILIKNIGTLSGN